MRVLYRDDLVIAIDKPAGVATVPGRSSGGTRASSGARAAPEEPLSAQVRTIAADALPVHRLDRDTSGVVLFALGKAAHRALSMSFQSRRAEKTYLGLCRGDLPPTRCDLPLTEGRKGAMRIAVGTDKRGQPSLTEFTPLERFPGFTWVEAHPRTGRTHQIRVHLAALGHPLAIDPRYGDSRPIEARDLLPGSDGVVLDRLPLHAAALRVPHPSGRGWLTVESPLPADLLRCLELLRAHRRG